MKRPVLVQTVVISSVFFLILFAVAYLASMVPVEGGLRIEPIYVFVSLVPFVVLLISSGKLKEVKGPGGMALLMRDEAERKISVEMKDSAIEVDPAVVHSKGGIDSLVYMMDENRPSSLSFVIGRKNYYAQSAIEAYMEKLGEFGGLENIIFVSDDGSFLGYMKADDFRRLLRVGDVVGLIESGEILKDKAVHVESIDAGSSNRETLSRMEECNVSEMAVVDAGKRFIGIVDQERIVRKILSRLVREA